LLSIQPESDPDAAQHAVEAGLEIVAALPKLNRELTNKGLKLSKPLRIRLGMHSGTVVVGAMGGGNRTETVNSDVLLLLLRLVLLLLLLLTPLPCCSWRWATCRTSRRAWRA